MTLEELEKEVDEKHKRWKALEKDSGNVFQHNSPEEIDLVDAAFEDWNIALNEYLDRMAKELG